MSKKQQKPNHNPAVSAKKTAEQAEGTDLLGRLETVLETNATKVFVGIFILALLLVAGLFEMKIGLANDDALYIEGAVGYATDFFGYNFKANAPLYPMILSVLVRVFGAKLFILKFMSTVFFLSSLFFIFKTFRGRIPYLVLFGAIFITATNSLFTSYASLTFTECFFAFIQSVFLFFVLKLTDKLDRNEPFGATWKEWLWVSIGVVVMYISRNVAVVILAVFVLFMALQYRKMKPLLLAFIPILIVVAIEIIKRLLMGDEASQYASQGNVMMRKYLFNPADPKNTAETPWGFVLRFLHNTEIYFGARFWELVGFREENKRIPAFDNGAFIFSTLFTLLLLIPGVIYSLIKRNKAVLLASLYFLGLCSVTFIALHVEWGQSRLIMIYFPFIFITLFFGLWHLFRSKALKGYQFFMPVVMLLFMVPNLLMSLKKVPKNLPVLSKNISGDEFYGYTPDWVNFFKASRWCARNLPEGSFVASRRAPMSFVYGDFKDFYPVYSLPSNDPDDLLQRFKENGVTHVMLAELRTNPSRYIPNRYIGTMHRYVGTIAQKYQIFELIHTEGSLEKTEVYKIRYDLVPAKENK